MCPDKKGKNLPVTLGIQMVLLPRFKDDIIPFAILGRELGVDYAVIKHCSDDETGSLGVDYNQYIPWRMSCKKRKCIQQLIIKRG